MSSTHFCASVRRQMLQRSATIVHYRVYGLFMPRFYMARSETPRRLVPWECLCNLPRDPFGRRMRRHIDLDELSSSQPDNDQDVPILVFQFDPE